jgi:hypothetical protein
MTIGYYWKEYVINGTTYFVEQYADKPYFVKLWAYGYIHKGLAYHISTGLRSRPNLKRLFGS